jgi:8-oxo-dGTP pyrophosphatase MutT (NUDIX family)
MPMPHFNPKADNADVRDTKVHDSVVQDVPIRPAATVILLRQHRDIAQVLLLRRNHTLVFGGDHWVFPGGRVDAQDYITAADVSTDAAARIAAVRETMEEARLQLEMHSLTPVSHWTTPKPSPKRYSTAFFVTLYGQAEEVIVDGSEIVDHQWLAARQAIEHYERGEKKMMTPTIHTLYEIARHPSAEDYIAMCAARQPLVYKN